MMHSHTWTLINAALRRYRCDCGVIGHQRARGVRGPIRIVPYLCQHELDERKHCGKPATYVSIPRTQNRCDEHQPNHRRDSHV